MHVIMKIVSYLHKCKCKGQSKNAKCQKYLSNYLSFILPPEALKPKVCSSVELFDQKAHRHHDQDSPVQLPEITMVNSHWNYPFPSVIPVDAYSHYLNVSLELCSF